MKKYCELHNHLYGSIPTNILYRIGFKNKKHKLDFFLKNFYKIYNKKINIHTFFDKYKDIKNFKNLYIFNEKSDFLHFQAKFNLIIALCKFDQEEIFYIAKKLCLLHLSQNIAYIEYRIMYPLDISKEDFYSKTIAACEGLKEGEILSNNQIKARLIISFHRCNENFLEYEMLKNLMSQNTIAKTYIVGIDFCAIEEGFHPSLKKNFFQQVLKDNYFNLETALSINYHVGESFKDKTLLSATRWVLESAIYGVHRLGHCLALGIEPDLYYKKEIKETVQERLNQLYFELEHYEELKCFISTLSKKSIENEILSLKYKKGFIKKKYDKAFLEHCRGFQNFCMNYLSKTNTVIECCPTSNERIGNLPNLKFHPLKRFIKENLKLTISTDDPGIFDTNIENEYKKASYMGIKTEKLEEIRKKSFSYSSELLSGRK